MCTHQGSNMVPPALKDSASGKKVYTTRRCLYCSLANNCKRQIWFVMKGRCPNTLTFGCLTPLKTHWNHPTVALCVVQSLVCNMATCCHRYNDDPRHKTGHSFCAGRSSHNYLSPLRGYQWKFLLGLQRRICLLRGVEIYYLASTLDLQS